MAIRIEGGKIIAECGICKKTFEQKEMLKSMSYCKACWRDYMRFSRYKITKDEYEALLEKQHGGCAICGKGNFIKKKNRNHVKNLAVDHDHNSRDKKIRGLLCGRCNRGLGFFNHDYELLSRGSRYLTGFST